MQDFQYLKIDEFIQDELIDAATNVFVDDVASTQRFAAMSLSTPHFGGNAAPPIKPNVFQSLHHPRMFGALVEMHRTSPEWLHRALDEEPEGLFHLAYEFIWLYLDSYNDRHHGSNGPTKSDYIRILKNLADRCQSSEDFARKRWHSLAQEAYLELTLSQARELFEETLSGGLIRISDPDVSEINQVWEWRHPFVADCLKRRPLEDWREYF